MKKKTKIFGIGAAVLLVMVSLIPVVNATVDSEISESLQSFVATNENEIIAVNEFLAETNITMEENVTQEMIDIVKDMLPAMEEIVADYIQSQSPPPGYDGHNAFWMSDEAYEFFDDNHLYWGFVVALDEIYSDLLCHVVLELEWLPGAVLVLLMAILPVPGIIWWAIMAILEETWGDFVDWIRDYASGYDYGIHFDWFKRDIPWPSPLLNKFFYLLQPDEPWDPGDIYEGSWTAIIGPC